MTPVWTDSIANLWWRVMLQAARETGSLWCTVTLRDGTRVASGQNIYAMLDFFKRAWA